MKRFKTDLHNCVAYIQEARPLKEKVRALFEKYVQRADMVSVASRPPLASPGLPWPPLAQRALCRQVEIAGLNTDLQLEYARQREHLERNLATLKKKVVKDSELHRTDYVRIMQVPARSWSAPSGAGPGRGESLQGPLRDHPLLRAPQVARGPASFP